MRAFLGYAGCLFLLIGQLIYFTLPSLSPLLFILHMVLGTLALLAFLVTGGARAIGDFNRRVFSSMLSVSLFFAATLILLLLFGRRELFVYDSTASRVYSLSEETKTLLGNLPGELKVRAFYLGGQIEDRKLNRLLREIRRYVTDVQVVDPEKNLLELERYGVTQSETLHLSLTLPDGTQRSAKGVSVTGEEAFLQVLKKVLRKDSPLIAFTKSSGEPSIEDKLEKGYLFAKEALEGEGYRVVATSSEVPEGTGLLIVAAPSEPFTEEMRRSIVRFLSRGGSIFLLNEVRRGGEVRGLSRLFGIEPGDNLIIELMPQGGMGVQPRITEFSAASSITRGFNRPVILSTATSVSRTGDERNVKELAFTSQSSWAETNLSLLLGQAAPVAALEPEDIRGPVPVMTVYDGSVGAPKLPGRAAVIGDAEFISNQHLGSVGNRDLFLNTVAWLLGEDRQQQPRVRTLAQSRERLSAEDRDRIFLMGAIFLPELLILLGLVILYRRGR
jgi:hypothetical protein